MKTTGKKAAGQRTRGDASAPPKPGTLASMSLPQGNEEPAKEAPPPDLAGLLGRSLEGGDRYRFWGALVEAGAPKAPADVLDDTLSRLWIDLAKNEEEHPSERARLATRLVRAAQLLLRDEQDENVRAVPAGADGRTRMTHGVKAYLEARGEPVPSVSRTWSVISTIRHLRHVIKEAGCLLKEKNPGTLIEDDPAIRASAVSYIVTKFLWDHDDWSAFRVHLRQNKQPANAPDFQLLRREIKGIFTGRYTSRKTPPPPPDAWPDLAARVLAAAVRVAGGDKRFADNILRSERGTPKGKQPGSVDNPRKQSGSVDSALLPPRRERKG